MSIAIGLCLPATAQAQFNFWSSTPPSFNPPEAVVRVAAPERDGTSYGSGTLVAVNDLFGLVVTNWHVVRDAAGPVTVFFPNGFRSGATILRTDRDWDLAALMIWRPNVKPIPISAQAPQLGEVLTIAGYGSGQFRALAGRCTQYVSPGGNLPFEMLELDAAARNGDSGGPIFNSRGELAGVLFGSAFGKTTGSYCGRLRWFLNSVDGDFHRAAQVMLAQRNRNGQASAADQSVALATPATPTANLTAVSARPNPTVAANVDPYAPPRSSPPSIAGMEPASRPSATLAALPTKKPLDVRAADAPPPAPVAAIGARPIAPASTTEQVKTLLAIIGAIALLYHALRWLGAAVG